VNGFIESASLGWKNPLVFGSLIVGLSCIVAFGLVEANVTAPMLPLRMFQSRSFSGANPLTLLLYAAIGIFFFLFPLNLIQVQGYSATATGAILPLIGWSATRQYPSANLSRTDPNRKTTDKVRVARDPGGTGSRNRGSLPLYRLPVLIRTLSACPSLVHVGGNVARFVRAPTCDHC
jgi:hypothetical protein